MVTEFRISPAGLTRCAQLTIVANQEKQWVGYDRISANLKRAIIAAEDAKFVDHEGFDWEGIQHAIEKNQRKGRIVAGGSTISQQLAKNLFLTPARTPWRKAEEAIITRKLGQLSSSEAEILLQNWTASGAWPAWWSDMSLSICHSIRYSAWAE